MSKNKLNKEQQDFLNSFDNNVLVSAGAGTGKTFAMINKLIYLICEQRIDVEKIMVVTFTNSAANEMKQKLILELEAEFNRKNGEEALYILNQIEKIENSYIGTIHSICNKLIKKYFYALDIQPGFSIIVKNKQQFLVKQALNDVLKSDELEKNADFCELYKIFNGDRNSNLLGKIILKIYEFLKSKADEEEWKQNCIKSCYNFDLNKNLCFKIFDGIIRKQIESVLTEIDKLYKIFSSEESCVKREMEYLKNIKLFCKKFTSLVKISDSLKLINSYEFVNKPRHQNKSQIFVENKHLYDELHEEFFKFKKFIFKHYNKSEEAFINDLKIQVKNVKLLFELVEQFQAKYTNFKQKENILDFNDLEKLTLKLLDINIYVSEIKSMFEAVFVDEYQDVNDIQESIILKISKNNNLFMIGDPKQSIYAFRLSRPETFVNKFNSFKEKNTGIALSFNKNYRSEINILEFANYIFSKLINKETLGINYKNEAMLECGNVKNFEKTVNVQIINRETSELDEEVDESIADKEAELVLQNIFEIKKHKFESKGETKYFDYKDIAILVRNKKELTEKIYKLLQKNNVPVKANLKIKLFEKYEILLIVNFLKLMANEYDDIALTSVLSSFMYKVPLQNFTNFRGDKFSESCLSYDGEDGFGKAIKKLKYDLNYYRTHLLNFNLLTTIEEIFKNFNFVLHFKNLPDGEEKTSNLEQFIKLVEEFRGESDLIKFLEFLVSIEKDEYDIQIGNNDNSVNLSTIHSSKGLEYPAVILCGLGKKFNLNKETSEIILNADIGMGINLFNVKTREKEESFVNKICKIQNLKKEIDEEIRLFYVAVTRAQNRLVLCGVYNLKNIISNYKKPIYESKNYFDLFFKATDLKVVSRIQNNDFFIANKNQLCEFDVNVYEDIETCRYYANKETMPILSYKDDDLQRKLLEYQKFEYPHKKVNSISLKNSVTGIYKERDDYENVKDNVYNFEINDDKININQSLLLGTYYHKIMEKINYNLGTDQIEKILEDTDLKRLKEEWGIDNVDLSMIKNAFICIKKLIVENSIIYKEQKFIMCDKYCNFINNSEVEDEIIVQGVIDLIIQNNDEIILIDFKTNKINNAESFRKIYQTQIDLYSKALAFNQKLHLKKFIYSFHLNKLIFMD